jgi:DeoR family ulaG and ulaABCDEF operon transcriptional repressor
VTRNFYARRMFMGAQGLGQLGLMEGDPLLIQAEQKLIDQADELVVLIDSSKFHKRSSLILCGLKRITTVITDGHRATRTVQMLEMPASAWLSPIPGRALEENSAEAGGDRPPSSRHRIA